MSLKKAISSLFASRLWVIVPLNGRDLSSFSQIDGIITARWAKHLPVTSVIPTVGSPGTEANVSALARPLLKAILRLSPSSWPSTLIWNLKMNSTGTRSHSRRSTCHTMYPYGSSLHPISELLFSKVSIGKSIYNSKFKYIIVSI